MEKPATTNSDWDWPFEERMRSPTTSMSQEHDSSAPVCLIPTSIAIVDDSTITATTTPPEDYYTQFAKQPQHHFPSYSPDPVNTNYYYPSSPETLISMSGSSTGSHSIPPQRAGYWDSALAMSSPPISPPSAVVLDPHTEASRLEAGVITSDNYKKGHWSAEVSLSDGGHGHGRSSSRSVVHDAPNTVTVYTTTAADKEGDRNREPNAVLVLVSLPP